MDELVRKIPEDSYFLHPIIVDKDTRVVLDGMHRVAASRALSLSHIPVCFVDYRNPNILLRCWYRTFRDLREGEAEKALRQLGFTWGETGVEEALGLIEERRATAALITGRRARVVGDGGDAETMYSTVRRMDKALGSRGMGFATERDALDRAARGEVSACVATPTLRKEEVVAVAMAGRVFPQKTTRHVIPARPMGVKVPLEWLVTDKDEAELNEKLRLYLSSRRIRRMVPGTVIDRKYEEPLYIFE
ncbi:hypothetical protein A3K81_03740 [Candidatus Bathyarchaeota archaeon RBG_13_60_20]|nr:MAG: hypothetical protein A3K81_03740 [Candidatus Bathyarchaeota archaeon RBG_13_60_20]